MYAWPPLTRTRSNLNWTPGGAAKTSGSESPRSESLSRIVAMSAAPPAQVSLGPLGELFHDRGGGLDPLHGSNRLAGIERHRLHCPCRAPARGRDRESRNRELLAGKLHLAHDLLPKGLGGLDAGAEHTVGRVGPHHRERLGEDRILGSCFDQGLRVERVGRGFFCRDEPRSDADGIGSRGKRRRGGASRADPASCDDRNLDRLECLAEEREEADLAAYMTPGPGALDSDQA